MCQVTVDIPDELLHDANMSAAETPAFVKQMAALGFYTRKSASIGCCAIIAGMSEGEFIDFLGQNKVSIFRFGNEAELARDYSNA